MDDMFKSVEEFTRTNPDPIEFLRFLRFEQPGLISDMRRAESLLIKDYSSDIKIAQIMQAYKVKSDVTNNRPHDGSEPKKPYAVYQKLFPQGKMTPKQFYEVFEIVDSIELAGEMECTQDATKAVSQLLQFGESNGNIVHLLKLYAANPAMVNFLYKYSESKEDEKDIRTMFMKINKILFRAPRNILDTLCLCTVDPISNDVLLENCAVYYQFISGLRENDSVLVVDPTIFFVRKWLQENYFPEGIKVIFAMEDSELLTTLSYSEKMRRNVRFISTDLLEKTITAEGTPAHTLIFGTRYHSVCELLKMLKRYGAVEHRISILASDFALYKAELCAELCGSDVFDRKVSLFPAGINYSTFPQRKILFSAKFGSGADSKNDAAQIDISFYSLKNEGDKQYLKRKMLVTNMEVQKYAAGDSFRKTYGNQEAAALLKTDRKRKQHVELDLTPEIKQYYTVSYSGGRYAVESYVCEPIFDNNRKRGELLDRTKKRIRRNSTTYELDMPFILMWANRVYPYEKFKLTKTKEVIDIREEIGQVYRQAYLKKDITLRTFAYIYPKFEEQLSKSNQERFYKIVGTELGEVLMSMISYEYACSILAELYDQEQEFDRQQAILVLSKALDFAIPYGHVNHNDLKELLDLDRREKKNLTDIRKNLVKNCFTAREIRQFYTAVLKEILAGKNEYIGLMIRLFTGLESNIVCALRWKDFRRVDGFTFRDREVYQLAIHCQLQNDGRAYKPFEKVQSYRNVPCAMVLADLLLKEKQRQLDHVAASEEMLLNIPIVRANQGMVSSDITEVFPPRKLNELAKKMIVGLNVPEQVIRIPDDIKGTIESNLADYHSDLLRSNYNHWAKHLGKCDEGEIAYLMGRKAAITFSVNYCDYDNRISQYQIFMKQNRIASTVLKENHVARRETVLMNSPKKDTVRISCTTPLNRTKRTTTCMEIRVPGGEGKLHTHIQNECGFDITVSQMEG